MRKIKRACGHPKKIFFTDHSAAYERFKALWKSTECPKCKRQHFEAMSEA